MPRRRWSRRRVLAASCLGAAWVGAGCMAAGPGAPAVPAAPTMPPRAADGADDARQPLGEQGAAARVLTRVSFGSCADETRPQPAWAAILAERPGLHLFGGDNVYASAQPWQAAALKTAYAQLAAKARFEDLRREVPHLAIWDDHDYGLNDGGAEFAHRAASRELFFDFWRVSADDERRRRGGVYHARLFGPPGRRVQVLMLDARWFRSPWQPTDQRGARGKERYVPNVESSRTLLGEEQWRWLAARLAEPAELRLVMSGIQVIAEGHGFEHWGLFPHEQQRLLDTIAATRARGVVLLSGDRHIGAVYRRTQGAPYPITEITASGLTHTWSDADEPGPNRVGALVRENHYGLIDIDWSRGQVVLVLKATDGRPLQQHVLDLARLA